MPESLTEQVAPFGFPAPLGPESGGASAIDQILALACQSNPFDYDIAEILPLQLGAFAERLDERRGQIAILDQRAKDLGANDVQSFEDLIPLLFAHMTYKSYPESFVTKGRWNDLLRWLDTVSSASLADVDVDGVVDIDAFIARLHEAGHYVMATSGTSGKCSLLPQSSLDMARSWSAHVSVFSWAWGVEADQSRAVFVLGAGDGPRRGVMISKGIAEAFGRPGARYWLTDEPVLVAEANRAGHLRRAMAEGTATPSDIQALERTMTDRSETLNRDVERMVERLSEHRDEPLIFWGQPSAFHELMLVAREKGFEDGGFHPDSAVMLGGGLKIDRLPDGWVEDVSKFQGPMRGARSCYGMSEVLMMFGECAHGRWHAPPTNIILVLDEAGEVLLNAESGEVEGRMAVFDIAQDGRWGGIVTSDKVRVRFSECECGLSSPTVLECSRYGGSAGDDKLSCAGTMDLYIRGVIDG